MGVSSLMEVDSAVRIKKVEGMVNGRLERTGESTLCYDVRVSKIEGCDQPGMRNRTEPTDQTNMSYI